MNPLGILDQSSEYGEMAATLQNEVGLSAVPTFLVLLVFTIVVYGLIALAVYLLWKAASKINDFIFWRMEKKRGKTLYIEFLHRVFAFAITAFFVVTVLGWEDLGRSLFGSAAVLTAIVGFAAQDVIKDTLAGLQISIYRPFDIGDRIELEDGTAGIVESITLRHVVLKKVDTIRQIVPNSKMNSCQITNYSYNSVPRSMLLKYPVSYNADVEKTQEIIAGVVRESPYTIPGKEVNGEKEYAPVYFLELADSALIFSVTVYYDPGTSTEVVKNAINTGVFAALKKGGIEIPYNYMNIVMREE